MLELNQIYNMDCLHGLQQLLDNSINCIVTSPPYYALRDYGIDGQIGLESSPEQYVDQLVQIFREAKRVLRKDGTLWLNLGDSYCGTGGLAGYKRKDLIGIPWLVAFALRNDGWYLRQDIIWHKPNAMPSSVKDRCNTAHEHIFLLAKSPKYYFDYVAIQEPAAYDGRHDTKMHGSSKYHTSIMPDGQQQKLANRGHERWQWKDGVPVRNKRSVWSIPTRPFKGAHFAVFPEALAELCILAGCPEGGVVLDPFMGSGTVAVVAQRLHRNYIGFEINPEYIDIANNRLAKTFLN
jgi:DNA modification methylase